MLEKGTGFDAKFYEEVNRIYMESLEYHKSDPQDSTHSTNNEDDMLNHEIIKDELQQFFNNYQAARKNFEIGMNCL